MNVTIELATALSVACALGGVVLSNRVHKREDRKEKIAEGQKDGALSTDVAYMKADIDETKRRVDKHDDYHLQTSIQIATVDAKANAANARIDALTSK